MKLTSLSDLFAQELKDMYSAENQLVKALPKMAKATTSPELQSAFQNHLEQTKEHVSRLEEVCRMIGASPKGKKCVAMEGLIEEGSELLKEKSDIDPEVLNAALIAAAQKVEHYEIASYGTLRSYAERLGQNDAVNLLQRTLDEEGETDKLLTTLSQQINPQATTAAHDGR
jgi:ferritin-like metal-binding protein YciE